MLQWYDLTRKVRGSLSGDKDSLKLKGCVEAVKWMRDDSDRETWYQNICYEPGREVEREWRHSHWWCRRSTYVAAPELISLSITTLETIRRRGPEMRCIKSKYNHCQSLLKAVTQNRDYCGLDEYGNQPFIGMLGILFRISVRSIRLNSHLTKEHQECWC